MMCCLLRKYIPVLYDNFLAMLPPNLVASRLCSKVGSKLSRTK